VIPAFLLYAFEKDLAGFVSRLIDKGNVDVMIQ
jgi:hypothetical protein